MWVRRDPADLAREADGARSPIRPAIYAAVVTAVVVVAWRFGIRSLRPGAPVYAPDSAPFSVSQLLVWLLAYSAVFVAMYKKQRRDGRAFSFVRADALLCTQCFDALPADRVRCKCGGALEPLSNWVWADEADVEVREQGD